MKTDTKRKVKKLKKIEARKTLKVLRRLGSYHFHTGVPFQQGPIFINRKYVLEWQRGWRQANAYTEGYKAGLTGAGVEKNPYRAKSRLGSMDLRGWWKNGHRAVGAVMKVYRA